MQQPADATNDSLFYENKFSNKIFEVDKIPLIPIPSLLVGQIHHVLWQNMAWLMTNGKVFKGDPYLSVYNLNITSRLSGNSNSSTAQI